MSFRTKIDFQNGDKYFYFEQLSKDTSLTDFSCSIAEYNEYLLKDALRSQNDHIALTWLLRERKDGELTAYMSLITDAIKLSISEKNFTTLIILSKPFLP